MLDKRPTTLHEYRPGIPKEILSYIFQWIARLRVHVSWIERLEVRAVHVPEVFLVPTGFPAGAITPLIDAALCLMMIGILSASRAVVGHDVHPYHCKYKGLSWNWDWGEMILENHAIIVLVLEPQDIYKLLYDRMSILVERIPKILFL